MSVRVKAAFTNSPVARLRNTLPSTAAKVFPEFHSRVELSSLTFVGIQKGASNKGNWFAGARTWFLKAPA